MWRKSPCVRVIGFNLSYLNPQHYGGDECCYGVAYRVSTPNAVEFHNGREKIE